MCWCWVIWWFGGRKSVHEFPKLLRSFGASIPLAYRDCLAMGLPLYRQPGRRGGGALAGQRPNH